MINDTQGEGHALEVGGYGLKWTGSILSEVTGDQELSARLGEIIHLNGTFRFLNSVEMERILCLHIENLKKIIFDMEYCVSIGAAKWTDEKNQFSVVWFLLYGEPGR